MAESLLEPRMHRWGIPRKYRHNPVGREYVSTGIVRRASRRDSCRARYWYSARSGLAGSPTLAHPRVGIAAWYPSVIPRTVRLGAGQEVLPRRDCGDSHSVLINLWIVLATGATTEGRDR